MKHLLKDRAPKLVRSKCLAENVKLGDTTVWWRDVTCPECLAAMSTITQQAGTITPSPPRKRLIRRRNST